MERALLVTADISSEKRGSDTGWSASERADELKKLAGASNADVIHEEIVKLKDISPAYFLGRGKTEEIYALCCDSAIGVVIFNNDLTGSQQKNLEDIIKRKTVDRTQLILDIFARRAKSNEGKIQVELAQLMYLLPRLTGKGILLSRLGGGIGTRGPGEQKLEVNRRRIRERITKLKRDLSTITKQHHTSRKQRATFSLLNIAIIGYTNAGKSTLLNSLTGSNVLAMDKLFCTLDPTIRSYILPNNQKVIFSDTVGFLDRLPHSLVDAFRATLEEVIEADLLIHVIDASHPKCHEHKRAVHNVLRELGAEGKTIIPVLNKIDKMDTRDIQRLEEGFDGAISISALKRVGLDRLIDRIVLYISAQMTAVTIEVPQHRMKIVKFLHEHAHILKKEYRGQNVYFEAVIPRRLKAVLGKQAEGVKWKNEEL